MIDLPATGPFLHHDGILVPDPIGIDSDLGKEYVDLGEEVVDLEEEVVAPEKKLLILRKRLLLDEEGVISRKIL